MLTPQQRYNQSEKGKRRLRNFYNKNRYKFKAKEIAIKCHKEAQPAKEILTIKENIFV